jgi:hypothetical protein
MSTTHDNIVQSRRRAVLAAMLKAGPDHFNMDTWFATPSVQTPNNPFDWGLRDLETVDSDGTIRLYDGHTKVITNIDDCGTTACLAGWCLLIAMQHNDLPKWDAGQDTQSCVAEWIAIDPDIFMVSQWPQPMKERRDIYVWAGLSAHEAEYRVITEYLVTLIND